jgi:hypothetical protein
MKRYPLSLAQQHIWAAVQNGFEPGWQHIYRGVLLGAPLAMGRLREAIARTTERHPVIASRVVVDDDGPKIYHVPGQTPDDCLIVLQETTSKAVAEKEIGIIKNREFDLTGEPPLRVIAVPDLAGSGIIYFIAHHLCMDVRAVGAMISDFAKYYFCEPGSEVLPPEPGPPSFFKYIEWELEQRGTPEFDRRIRYWQEELSGGTGDMSFVGKKPDPPTSNRKVIRLELDQDLVKALKRFAGERRLTVFTVLLSALQRTIWENLKVEDIVFQIVADGRRSPFTGTVGQFGDFMFLRQAGIPPTLSSGHLDLVGTRLTKGLSRYVPYFGLLDNIDWFTDRVRNRPFAYTGSEVFVRYLARPDIAGAFRTVSAGVPVADLFVASPPLDAESLTPAGYDGVLLQIDFSVFPSHIVCFFGYEPAVISDSVAAILGEALISNVRQCLTMNDSEQ